MKCCQTHDVAEGSCGDHREPAKGHTILVVDDDAVVRRVVRSLLERFGYRVLAASCAAEAEAVFETHGREVSLLLSDVNMPGGDGPDLCRRLHRKVPDLPVIYMSGSPEGAQAAIKEGRTLLAKPFEVGELLEEVCRAIGEGS